MATIARHLDQQQTQTFLGQKNGILDLERQLPGATVVGAASNVVGFGNAEHNCWCNALLQMVVHVPSLRTAYEVFAHHYQHSADHSPHATLLLRALEQYETCLQMQAPVPPSVSQDVRSAMHHFFSKISLLASQNEDAHEALQLLMGGYQEIAERSGIPCVASLYTPMQTDRLYDELAGSRRAADPNKLELTRRRPDHRDAYSRLSEDLTSSRHSPECQILIDLQNRTHLSFSELLKTYFRTQHDRSDLAVYLRPDDHIQDFRLKEERRRFQSVPQELILSVKRFGFNPVTEEGFKINDPVAIPRSFALPPEATLSEEQPIYDLDLFVVHYGESLSNGHYIAYRKLDGMWIECDDSTCRPRSGWDVEQILKNSYIHYYKLRTQEGLEEGLSARAEIAQAPPSSIIAESSFFRRLPQELKAVEVQLKQSNPNDPVVRRIQLWHQECASLRRSQLKASELRAQLIAGLEKALGNPDDPTALFSPDLFGENAKSWLQNPGTQQNRPFEELGDPASSPTLSGMVSSVGNGQPLLSSQSTSKSSIFPGTRVLQPALEPIVQFMIRKMRTPHSLFFSERINLAVEFHEVKDLLSQCDLNDPVAYYMQCWYEGFSPLLMLEQIDPLALRERSVQMFEMMLKDPAEYPKIPFSPVHFGERAGPMATFLIGKMRDKSSPFFSSRVDEAAPDLQLQAEELTFKERVEQLKALCAQLDEEDEEAAREEQELRERIQLLAVESDEKLMAIHDQFQAKIAPIQQKTEENERATPEKEERLKATVEQLGKELVELKEDIKELQQENGVVQEKIKEVKQGAVQLEVTTKRLEVAIKEKQKEMARNQWIQVALVVVSAVLTYGTCTAMGATALATKTATTTMAGLTFGAAGSGGPKRGPPPPK